METLETVKKTDCYNERKAYSKNIQRTKDIMSLLTSLMNLLK